MQTKRNINYIKSRRLYTWYTRKLSRFLKFRNYRPFLTIIPNEIICYNHLLVRQEVGIIIMNFSFVFENA